MDKQKKVSLIAAIALYIFYLFFAQYLFADIEVHRFFSVAFFFIICFITYRLHLERFSILHLVMLGCFVFVYSRYFVGMLFSYYSDFTLGYGNYYHPSNYEITESFFLFNTGFFFLWVGMVFFIKKNIEIPLYYGNKSKNFAINATIFYLVILVLSLPFDLYQKTLAVINHGYDGLYLSQAGYKFDFFRVISILLPITFSLSLFSGKFLLRIIAYTLVFFYSIALLLLGARESVITWMICIFWVYEHTKQKKIPNGILALIAGIAILIAIGTEFFRGNSNTQGFILFDFLYKQGFTAVVAIPAWHIDGYSKYALITMLAPVGGLLSMLGIIKSSIDMNIFNYFSYSINPDYFANGHGLGWSVFLDLYHLSIKNVVFYSALCFLLGGSISILNNKAFKKSVWGVVFIALIPKIVYLPRAGLFIYTNNFLYFLLVLFITWFTFCLIKLILKKNWVIK